MQHLSAFLHLCIDGLKIHRRAVVGFQLIVAAFGLCHQGNGLFQQLVGGPLVEPQPGPAPGQILPVQEAGAPHGLHAGQLHRVPAVIREERQPQGGDENVVDLILRVQVMM